MYATYQHAVFVRMTGIFNDWNNVGALLGDVYQVTTRAMRKFNSINKSFLKSKRGFTL